METQREIIPIVPGEDITQNVLKPSHRLFYRKRRFVEEIMP